MSNEYALACSETLSIINSSTEEEKNRIPQSFINFLIYHSDKNYSPNFDSSIPIKDLKLRQETKGLLSLIFLSYLSDDAQKQEFNKELRENSLKTEQALKDKYDIQKIFANSQKEAETQAQQATQIDNQPANMVEYKKESAIRRFFNKIKNFFRGKK